MRTKLNFKIDAFKVEVNGKQIETPQVDIVTEVETTIAELKDLYELKKVMLKESPELIEEFMKKFVALQKTVEETVQVETIVHQTEENIDTEQLENESLDEWFRKLYVQEKVDIDFTNMYHKFCKEQKIRPRYSVLKWDVNEFFKMNLGQKREFANRVADYFTKGF